MREAFRQNTERIPAGFDYLLMISHRWPKKSNVEKTPKMPTFEQVKVSFLALAKSLLETRGTGREPRDTK
jgi:hypothetical protein